MNETGKLAAHTANMFSKVLVFMSFRVLSSNGVHIVRGDRFLQNWPEHRNGVIPKPAGYRPLGHRLGGDGMGAGKIGVLTAAHFGS